MSLGAWLSAALEDPNVCAEAKADIQAWFDQGEPPPPMEFPYNETFWAISDAIQICGGDTIGISVKSFQDSFNRRMAERKANQ